MLGRPALCFSRWCVVRGSLIRLVDSGATVVSEGSCSDACSLRGSAQSRESHAGRVRAGAGAVGAPPRPLAPSTPPLCSCPSSVPDPWLVARVSLDKVSARRPGPSLGAQHLAPQWRTSEARSTPGLPTEASGVGEILYIGAVRCGSHW